MKSENSTYCVEFFLTAPFVCVCRQNAVPITALQPMAIFQIKGGVFAGVMIIDLLLNQGPCRWGLVCCYVGSKLPNCGSSLSGQLFLRAFFEASVINLDLGGLWGATLLEWLAKMKGSVLGVFGYRGKPFGKYHIQIRYDQPILLGSLNSRLGALWLNS